MITAMKDTVQSRRCFVIGNGPSLRAENLSKLTHEASFASSRIYEIYEQTDWRSTYYCIHDMRVAKNNKKDINAKARQPKTAGIGPSALCPRLPDAVYIKALDKAPSKVFRRFDGGLL